MVYFRILEMKKWDDTLLLKCFDGKLKNDFIREDEEVVEARLSFLEKNQRYILNTNLLCLLVILSVCVALCLYAAQSFLVQKFGARQSWIQI